MMMLKACPRCGELVLDDRGSCRRCQKRFARDHLQPLSSYEVKKLLLDRQKEKASLLASGEGKKKGAWLRYPLRLLGWLLGALAVFFMLHLVVMEYTRNLLVTMAVAFLTILTGYLSAVSLAKAQRASPFAQGRLGEVEESIRLLEEALLR